VSGSPFERWSADLRQKPILQVVVPEMVPDAAYSSYGPEYFCFEGDGLWTTSDRDLIELAKGEIQKVNLATSSMPVIKARKRFLISPPTHPFLKHSLVMQELRTIVCAFNSNAGVGILILPCRRFPSSARQRTQDRFQPDRLALLDVRFPVELRRFTCELFPRAPRSRTFSQPCPYLSVAPSPAGCACV
jgi:hypothetical protein